MNNALETVNRFYAAANRRQADDSGTVHRDALHNAQIGMVVQRQVVGVEEEEHS